jgi:hypothetical protein
MRYIHGDQNDFHNPFNRVIRLALRNNSTASTNSFYRSENRMLSQAQHTTILELNAQQVSKRG